MINKTYYIYNGIIIQINQYNKKNINSCRYFGTFV
jgi:hypothetical protein